MNVIIGFLCACYVGRTSTQPHSNLSSGDDRVGWSTNDSLPNLLIPNQPTNVPSIPQAAKSALITCSQVNFGLIPSQPATSEQP